MAKKHSWTYTGLKILHVQNQEISGFEDSKSNELSLGGEQTKEMKRYPPYN